MIQSRTLFAKPALIAALLTLASAALSTTAFAAKTDGYVTDASGNIARNADGSCWRSGSWTPALALPECQVGDAKPGPMTADGKAIAPVGSAPMQAAGTKALTLSADGLFNYAKATLRKGSDAELAPIADQLKSSSQITITGHTDRLGNAQRNMALSKARAESVKRYLVAKGMKASTITTQGMGSAAPSTKGDQCPGKASPALIQCLEADRRVDIQAK